MSLRDVSEDSFLSECLRQVARGDSGALKALYDATRSRLWRLAYRMLAEREAAEDTLQEAYLIVWRKAHLFNPGGGEPLAWLKTIVRNKALDVLRARRGRRADDLTAAMNLADPAATADVELLASLPGLRRGFDSLTPRNARVVRSIYYEGLSFFEVAQREQAPLSTVKSWVRRSLLQMRTSLEAHA